MSQEKKYDEVFISYSKLDINEVKPLCDALHDAGINYWIDKEGVRGSSNFLKEITATIKKCKIVLFVASQNSAKSKWTQKEVLYAFKQEKPVYPYKLSDFSFESCDELDFCFTNVQWEDDIEKVVGDILKLLGREPIVKKEIPNIGSEYDWHGEFYEGVAQVRLNNKYGFIDSSGKLVIPLIYDNVYSFSEGLAKVRIEGKSGFISPKGDVVIPLVYDGAGSFKEGLAQVKSQKNGKWGYIDTIGRFVIDPKFECAYEFVDGLAHVRRGTMSGVIDKTGAEVIPCKYEQIGCFSENLAIVKLNNKYGVIDKIGNEVVLPMYDFAFPFSEGLALVSLDGKYGYIDKTGKEVISRQFDDAESYKEGLAAVKIDGKWGYINQYGVMVIPCNKYTSANSFNEGLAMVEYNGLCGYINQTGKEVTHLKYLYATSFCDGCADVTDVSGFKYRIDKNGNRVK